MPSKRIDAESTQTNTRVQPRGNSHLFAGATLILSGVAGLAISRNYRIPSAAMIALGTTSLLWGLSHRPRKNPQDFKKSEEELESDGEQDGNVAASDSQTEQTIGKAKFNALVKNLEARAVFTPEKRSAALQYRWKHATFEDVAKNEGELLFYHYPVNAARLKRFIEAQTSLDGLVKLIRQFGLSTSLTEYVGNDFAPLQALVGKFYHANAETATDPRKSYRLIKNWNLKASPEVEKALAQARADRARLSVPPAGQKPDNRSSEPQGVEKLKIRLDELVAEFKEFGASPKKIYVEPTLAVQRLQVRYNAVKSELQKQSPALCTQHEQELERLLH